MPTFPNMPSGTPNPRTLRRKAHGRFSPFRAWHGQEIDLVVDFELIPEGTSVKLVLLEEGEEDVANKIKEWTCTVEQSSCKQEKVKFDFNELGYEGSASRFYYKIQIEDFELEADSEILQVDTAPFYFS